MSLDGHKTSSSNSKSRESKRKQNQVRLYPKSTGQLYPKLSGQVRLYPKSTGQLYPKLSGRLACTRLPPLETKDVGVSPRRLTDCQPGYLFEKKVPEKHLRRSQRPWLPTTPPRGLGGSHSRSSCSLRAKTAAGKKVEADAQAAELLTAACCLLLLLPAACSL